jgi:hypothetical protein
MTTFLRKKYSVSCWTAALFIQLLVYFFRIDKDLLQFREFAPVPHVTHTEAPPATIFSYFENFRFERTAPGESIRPRGARLENKALWKAIALLCDSRVKVLLARPTEFSRENRDGFSPISEKHITYPSFNDDTPAA